MSIFSGIGHFLGTLFGGNDDEEKKKRQQQQQQAQQARQAPAPQAQSATPFQNSSNPSAPAPDNSLHVVLPGADPAPTYDFSQALKKAQAKTAAQKAATAQTVANINNATGGSPLQKAQVQPTAPTSNVQQDSPLSIVPGLKPVVNLVKSGFVDPALNVGKDIGNFAISKGVFGSKLQPYAQKVDPAKFAGDTAITAINALTAGEGGALLHGGGDLAKAAIGDAGSSLLKKAGTNLIKTSASAAPVAAGYGAASTLAAGDTNLHDIAKNTLISTAVAPALGIAHGVLPIVGDGLSKASNLLKKAEVAPGIKSVNPTQAEDAAAAQAAQAEQSRQASIDVPTFQRNNADQLVAQAQNKVENLNNLQKVQPDNQATRMARQQELATAMAIDPQSAATVLRKQLLQKAVGANDPVAAEAGLAPIRARAEAELNNAREIQAARDMLRPAEGQSNAVPVENTPAAVTPQVPVDAPLIPAPAEPIPGAAVTAPTPPVEPSPAPIPALAADVAAPEPVATPPAEAAPVAAESAPTLPTMPESAGQPTADVAPLSHDALVKQLGPAAEDLKGQYSKKVPINIDELKQNAAGVIANMSDDDLLKSFSTTGPDTMIRDSQSFSLARAALDRLSQLPEDPHAVQTVSNIMDALDRYVSKSGEGLRIAQEEFDNMPLPMKVRYIVKKIDAANAETKGYQALADDPAKAAVVEATITGHLQTSQQISERIAAIQGQLNDVADAALNGQKVDTNIRALTKTLKTEQLNLEANNGELVKYYSSLIPGRSAGQRAFSDFPRRMMLASFTGRVNDVITTAANIGHLGVHGAIQGVLAKAVNLVKPGTITDTSRGVGRIFTGGAQDLRKTVGEVKGTQYTPDLARALQSNTEGRSGLQKAQGPIGRTVQAATEAATNLSAGVRDQRVYQLAVQEAQKAGLKGELGAQYAEARAAVPSRQMLEKAHQLHMEVNNLNENPISRTLNRISAAIDNNSGVGGFIKNQIIPFTSWLGGNIWNTITDKNVVASFVKLADSARKGDAEGIAQNLSKFASNSVQAYGLGYLLTQAGVLTNENAEGYNDAGAYFHVGDRYIPVGLFGFFAPNIVLGNAAYNGIHDDKAGSTAEKVASGAEKAILNLAQSVNAAGALGVDNNLSRSVIEATKKGGSLGNAAATFAGNAAGQFIPALAGDANAVLNNGLKIGGKTIIPDSLNPTHEKADTKVVNPNSPSGTAKDVPASALKSLENRVPFLSQSLPRKADVAASDLRDRISRGDRGTVGGEQAKADKKAVVDQTKDFKARDIPDPNGKNFDQQIQARTESGEYDKAIEGLQAKLKVDQGNKDIPKSKNKETQDKITTLQVTQKGSYDPKVIDLYKKTNLSEWRDMGDPESDNYDPETYKLLFNYDKDLADAGVSRNATKASEAFYSAKKPKKSSGRGGRSGSGSSTAKSNTIGNTPDLGKVSLGDLAPQKAGSVPIPTIQQVKAGDLIKKRQISVGKA